MVCEIKNHISRIKDACNSLQSSLKLSLSKFRVPSAFIFEILVKTVEVSLHIKTTVKALHAILRSVNSVNNSFLLFPAMNKLIDVNKLYKEDTELKKDDVEMLLKWSEQQRHFPKVTELQAALALHSCFYSIESAKNCLENYFTIRTLCPDYFSSFDPRKNDLLKQQMNVSLLAFLPGTTKNGDTIALTRLMDTNPDVYNPQVGSKMFDMLMMLRMYTVGPTNGIVVVMDMKGSVFMHVTKMNLGEFKKFMVYLQTAMPIRLKQVHFINTVPFMDKLMSMLKPFINKDMFDKIIIHTNNENLYKYVPREAMPVEYGGKADSVDILFEECKKYIYDNLEFYEMLESQVVDENKRVGPRKNVDNMFGFDGTFKKLEVD